jgi:predicted transcriptional regulator
MLTPLELDIMKAVWRHPPITVREVHEAIQPSRSLAYTTVMTIMDRLHQKGILTRELKARTHHYEPAITYEDAREEALASLVNGYFGGSREDLLDFLSRNGTPVYRHEPDNGVLHPNSIDEVLL